MNLFKIPLPENKPDYLAIGIIILIIIYGLVS